jgi:hypothetical protein
MLFDFEPVPVNEGHRRLEFFEKLTPAESLLQIILEEIFRPAGLT